MEQAVLEAITFFLSDVIWLSHLKALHACVVGLLVAGRLGVQKIGGTMPATTAVRHCIKRCSRFVNNDKIPLNRARRRLLWALTHRHSQIVVALDWTEGIGRWEVLKSAVVGRGRAIPVLWSVAGKEQRNAEIEIQHLRTLLEYLPESKTIVVLTDRGFDSSAFLRFMLGQNRLHFISRFACNISIRRLSPVPDASFHMMADLELPRNVFLDLGLVEYTQEESIFVRVVRVHAEEQAEPWNLATNLDLPAKEIAILYGRRFTIEEMFRDIKGGGWHLEKTRLGAKALEVMLLIGTVAYIVVLGAGLFVDEAGRHNNYQAQSGPRVISLFQLGLMALRRGDLPADCSKLPYDRICPPLEDLVKIAWRPQPRSADEKGPYRRPAPPPGPTLSVAALKVFLLKGNLTQGALAQAIGIHRTVVSTVLRERMKIPPAWIPKLLTLGSIDREELFDLPARNQDLVTRIEQQDAIKQQTKARRSVRSLRDLTPSTAPSPLPSHPSLVPARCLQLLLAKYGMTQGKLAALIGVHRTRVCQATIGESGVPGSWIARLADATGITEREFYSLAEEESDILSSVPKRIVAKVRRWQEQTVTPKPPQERPPKPEKAPSLPARCLQLYLLRYGLTHEALAKTLNVHRTMVSRATSGSEAVPSRWIPTLVAAYDDIECEQLWSLTDEQDLILRNANPQLVARYWSRWQPAPHSHEANVPTSTPALELAS